MKASVTLFIALFAAASAIAGIPAPAAAHGGDHDWGDHDWGGRGWGDGGWGVGIGIGVVPGPYYYPPPVYYAPPPVYYAPPPPPPPPPPGYYAPYPGFIGQVPAQAAQQAPVRSPAGVGESCDAGSYVCPMEVAVPAGGRCYCPGNDGERVYGTAR